MIIQLLGVALISLLTITPTIQQNNIEQLIAPNIEIQPMQFNYNNNQDKLYIKNQFSYAININTTIATDYNTHMILYTNTNTLLNTVPTDLTFSSLATSFWTFIQENDFYIFDRSSTNESNAANMTGNVMRDLINDYYQKTRGTVTSSSFTFTQTTTSITATATYYTYTINGTGGSLQGRIYVVNSVPSPFATSYQNTNVTVPAGTTLETIVEQYLIPTNTVPTDHSVLYYAINQNSTYNNQTAGTYDVLLTTRYSYGNTTSTNITINIVQSDTTPPVITSITGNPTDWTNQNVTLTINATDETALGDLNTPPYSFDNGVTYQFSNQKTFTTNEIVNIRVRDLSNNFTNQQVIINRIDKQSPSVTLPQGWTNQYTVNTITAQQLLATYNITDNQSGVNTSLTTISNFNPSVIGSYNPLISVTDNVGNTFNYTSPTVTIVSPQDTTGPTISGPASITRTQGNINTQEILSNYTITDVSGVEPNTTSIRDLNNNIINVSNLNVGTYQLMIYARDTLNNVGTLDFELIVIAPPPVDNEPPVITGSLLTSFVIGTYTSTSEILALYTITDNEAVGFSQVLGTINFEQIGDYPVTISATDTSNNTSILNIVVRIRADVILGNYNPLTDLISGIFGAGLSMIFTLGTINVLGFRVLDGMGIIILGFVIFMIYKVIRGGN
jgi:hypothetical protein